MQYLRDVTAVLQQRSLASGALVREVPLPGLGSIDVHRPPRAERRAVHLHRP